MQVYPDGQKEKNNFFFLILLIHEALTVNNTKKKKNLTWKKNVCKIYIMYNKMKAKWQQTLKQISESLHLLHIKSYMMVMNR